MLAFIETIIDNLPDWGPRLLEASYNTLALAVLGFLLAFVLGLLLDLMRTARSIALRRAAKGWMLVMRGIPILVILYLLYFALPSIGVRLRAFTAGVIGLALVHSAYLAEVFRAGQQSVARGQRESALAVGFSPFQVFRLIIFPQAIRVVLPPLLISMIALLKDSSICALIAVNELTLASRAIMSETFLPLHVFVLTGLFYFALAWPASLCVKVIERRFHHRSASRRLTKISTPAGYIGLRPTDLRLPLPSENRGEAIPHG